MAETSIVSAGETAYTFGGISMSTSTAADSGIYYIYFSSPRYSGVIYNIGEPIDPDLEMDIGL